MTCRGRSQGVFIDKPEPARATVVTCWTVCQCVWPVAPLRDISGDPGQLSMDTDSCRWPPRKVGGDCE